MRGRFHALEVSANGTLAAEKRGAEAHGADVTVLEFEVPVHYLILAGEDPLHRIVDRGVHEARRWCDDNEISFVPIDRSDYYDSGVSLRFIDHLAGRLGGRRIEADLLLEVRDAQEFVSGDRQRADLAGSVTCSLVEGEATVISGHARVFVDQWDPTRKRMEYVAHPETSSGRVMTLTGLKTVESTSLREAVKETTTMRRGCTRVTPTSRRREQSPTGCSEWTPPMSPGNSSVPTPRARTGWRS